MLKKFLCKIPGFRTGKRWKMVVAVILYLLFLITLTNLQGVTFGDKIIEILSSLILLGIPFVLITNLEGIRDKLPIFNKKTIKANILGSFITFILMIISFSMINQLKSPEQKQLDLISVQQSEQLAKAKLEEKKEASDLSDKIIALGDIDLLTYDKAGEIKSIRREFEALTSEQKKLVTKLELLESAEKKIEDIIAEGPIVIDNKLMSLGNIELLTLDKANEIMSIRKEYEALSLDQRAHVTKLDLLESAEKKIERIRVEMALELDTKIASLGDADTLTYDKAGVVSSIRKEYEELNAEHKLLISNIEVLESAEKRISDLKLIADQKAAEEKAEADKKAAEAKAEAERKAAEAKAAEDYQDWINSQFSAWDGSHIELVKLVKENLNDPKSYDHVETVYWDKGTYLIVKMTYRAKNGFGALVLQNVTANADYASNYITIVSQND